MRKSSSENSGTATNFLSPVEISELHPHLQDIVDYRKSGLSLNHIIGCPLNCAYCVRHFFDNFKMKTPHMLATDEEAVRILVKHKYFVPHKTPLQIFNRATDPFLPAVRPHTHRVLQLLDEQGFENLVLIITRYKVTVEDMELLESLRSLRITLLFTYSGLNGTQVEPIPKSVTLGSIDLVNRCKQRVRSILYWRPIVSGWNDDELTINHVLNVAQKTDAIAYTGLFYRPEQQKYFDQLGVKVPYEKTHRRKILPEELEPRILGLYQKSRIKTPIFRKTSCAVAFVHGIPDYNGHYGVRDICDICLADQVERCAAAHTRPTHAQFKDLLHRYGYETAFYIDNGHVWTHGLGEQRRYHLQHTLGFQVWDRDWPHFPKQHGRAPIGYSQLVTIQIPDFGKVSQRHQTA